MVCMTCSRIVRWFSAKSCAPRNRKKFVHDYAGLIFIFNSYCTDHSSNIVAILQCFSNIVVIFKILQQCCCKLLCCMGECSRKLLRATAFLTYKKFKFSVKVEMKSTMSVCLIWRYQIICGFCTRSKFRGAHFVCDARWNFTIVWKLYISIKLCISM